MRVLRRTIVTELESTINCLKSCIVDIADDREQERGH